MNVFTYGSLMFDPVWGRVVRGRYRSEAAWLDGYRRFAVRGEAYPAVVGEPGAGVSGRVWFDVGPEDLARLDAFEEGYVRTEVEARVARGPVRAGLYVFQDRSRLESTDWDATRFERDHMADFADRHLATIGKGR